MVPQSTRRALLVAVPALALATSAAAAAGPHEGGAWTTWRSFIHSMAFMHPNGRATALSAFDAGMRLEDLQLVSFVSIGKPDSEMPVLMFKTDGAWANFDPKGRY